MKRLVMILAVIVVLAPISVWAQDAPKADIFGGFSVYTATNAGVRSTPVGWQAAVAGHLSPRFALVGDFGGQYKDGNSVYQYLGGARVTEHMEKASVFAHALFGTSKGSGDSAFTMGYGGGLDYDATQNIAIRVIQFDWLPIHNNGVWNNNSMRFGFGVVYKIRS